MVSDTVTLALLAVVGTASGALIGLFVEPVRARFALKAHQRQLRRELYGELRIKLQRVLGMYINYSEACDNNNLVYLESTNKLEIPGIISFDDETTTQAKYYQLTSEEFTPLALAYLHLRWAVNHSNQFGSKKLDIRGAKKALKELERRLQSAVCLINRAFEENTHFLEKLDKGTLLNDWRELRREVIEKSGWKKLRIQEHLKDCVEPAEDEEPAIEAL
jgi:hypothetical protein